MEKPRWSPWYIPIANILCLASCTPASPPATQAIPSQDYTRGIYEPFAFDNVVPYTQDNDEAFYPPEYHWGDM